MFGRKGISSYSRRGLYYPSRFYRYRSRGTIARSAAGARAAKKSTKIETFSCTVNGVCTVTQPAGLNLSNVATFHPFQGGITEQGTVNDAENLVYGGAINDRGFRMKCACYDEVKLDAMRISFTPAQWGQQRFTTCTICTMWDRKATPRECGYAGAADWMSQGHVPTSAEVFNNEGTIKSPVTSNQIYGYRRYCQASSIIEKGGYHDATIYYNPTVNQSPLLWMYQDAWIRAPLAFSPALYLVMYCPASLTTPQTYSLTYKIEYQFTFRNPKSDMTRFLTLETPNYINPEGRAVNIEPNMRKKEEPQEAPRIRSISDLFMTSEPASASASVKKDDDDTDELVDAMKEDD